MTHGSLSLKVRNTSHECRLAIDDNVLKIDNNEVIKERSKHLVYEGAKYDRCIYEAKGYDKELTRSIACHTCCFWLIPIGYGNQIIPSHQIKLNKVPCIAKLVEKNLNARNMILVCDVILLSA